MLRYNPPPSKKPTIGEYLGQPTTFGKKHDVGQNKQSVLQCKCFNELTSKYMDVRVLPLCVALRPRPPHRPEQRNGQTPHRLEHVRDGGHWPASVVQADMRRLACVTSNVLTSVVGVVTNVTQTHSRCSTKCLNQTQVLLC